MQMHASCAAREGAGVLLLGPPGAGKSDLLLQLLDHGLSLVADDRVEIEDGLARPAAALAGLMEVRGLGIVRLPYVAPVRLALAVVLGGAPARLPHPARHPELDLPLLALDPTGPSAAARVLLALDCARGRVPMLVGAFAA
jgi:HPr kinase/phosphorylase